VVIIVKELDNAQYGDGVKSAGDKTGIWLCKSSGWLLMVLGSWALVGRVWFQWKFSHTLAIYCRQI